MKIFSIICLVLISTLCFSQTTSTSIQNMYAVGVTYNNSGSPAVAGTGLYSHLLSDGTGTYAFTAVDALPASVHPFTVTSNIGIGIAQKAFSIGKIPILIPTAAGVSWTGSNTGWQWNTGVLFPIRVNSKKNWFIIPNVRVVKSSVGGTPSSGYQPMAGFLVGWGK